MLAALGEVFEVASACAVHIGGSLVNVCAEAAESALVLGRAVVSALLHHVVVALQEVSHLTFAELGVAQLASWRRPAQHEVPALLCAVGGTLVGIDQLSEGRGGVHSLHIYLYNFNYNYDEEEDKPGLLA